MDERYNIKLKVFEGPLDLLLFLIKINEADIYNIPITEITQQYIDYIDFMQEIDIDVVGEFLLLAATLMKIKSRMLLPDETADEDDSDDDWEDPRKELVKKLLEYKKYKELASYLKTERTKVENTFSRSTVINGDFSEGEVNYKETDFFSLLTAFRSIIEKQKRRLPDEIEGEEIKIEDKINFILEKVNFTDLVRFSEIFSSLKSKQEMIVTFMAVLELIKKSEIKAKQSEVYQEIYLYKNE